MSRFNVLRSRSPRRGAVQWRKTCEEYERFIGTQAELLPSARHRRRFAALLAIEAGDGHCRDAAPETAWDVELALGDGTVLRLRKS